jgi:hypothetical protein
MEVVAGADITGQYTKDRSEWDCLDAIIQFFDHPIRSYNDYKSIIISALIVIGLALKGR